MNYLAFLEKEIHSVIMATADDRGLPVTCAAAIIINEHCLHCGNCLSACPQKAIVKEG